MAAAPIAPSLSALLQVKTLGELLDEKSARRGRRGRVLLFEHDSTVADALETLQRHDIIAAPVFVFPTLRSTLGEGACAAKAHPHRRALGPDSPPPAQAWRMRRWSAPRSSAFWTCLTF